MNDHDCSIFKELSFVLQRRHDNISRILSILANEVHQVDSRRKIAVVTAA